MSDWTHAICTDCWNELHPDKPAADTDYEADKEICCFCGESTWSGIYIRHDPQDPELICGGEHGPD